MLRQLSLVEDSFRSSISGYELGTREPPLPILLSYARIAGVYVDALIDDELDLPDKLPSSPTHAGVKSNRGSTSKRR